HAAGADPRVAFDVTARAEACGGVLHGAARGRVHNRHPPLRACGLGIPLRDATPLDRHKSYKPLDVGNGIVSGAVTPSGRWLSLGIAHPLHGRIELTRMEPFAGSRFD